MCDLHILLSYYVISHQTMNWFAPPEFLSTIKLLTLQKVKELTIVDDKILNPTSL